MIGAFYLQSEYSILKNIIPLEQLVKKAKSSGYDFLALSDDNNLHGVVAFHQLCQKYQIKPLTGMKVDCFVGIDKTAFLLYAKTQVGYQNLVRLSTTIQTKKEMITFEEVLAFQEGILFISTGVDSIIERLLIVGEHEKALSHARFFKEKLLDFCMGLSLQSFEFEMKHAQTLITIANDLAVLVLPVNKTAYLEKSDREILNLLAKIADENSVITNEYDFSFIDNKQLQKRFQDYAFVFDNIELVLKKIEFIYPKYDFKMPVFTTPHNVSSKEYLNALAAVGLKKRLKGSSMKFETYDERLRYELKVIDDMGFNDYFLVVYDFVNFAKKKGIIVGPGRGSVAGSLVSYVLGITEIDPLKYDLLFERFLNPARRSMPDIDMDFPDNKRDEVIYYVADKYGYEHICSISTFATFGYKQALRDFARILKVDNTRLSGILSRIEKNTIDNSDDLGNKLIALAQKIEGLPRHIGTHAAGIILSDDDLSQIIPLQNGAFPFLQSQVAATDLETIGLLKIDFLGIRNLAIIDDVLKYTDITDLRDIPLDDKLVYQLLKEGDTTGIFQLESPGMRNVLRKMNPADFEDIVAVLALYRPGPMDNIDEYIKRKNGEQINYLHPDLIPILKNTYGVLVYQEQIMQIAVSFADYSYAEADLLRRAVSKKDKSILDREKEHFIDKCRQKKYSLNIAEEIYNYILKFANYGFNRSHSVAYALVAYQMAYLKVHYYTVFMGALMSSVIGNENLTLEYIKEIRRKNVVLLPPDINISSAHYVIENDQLYYPLLGIKGIGQEMVRKIIEEREKGLFKSYQDFKMRTAGIINKKILEQLIYSGALDGFGYNQKTLLMHNEIASVEYARYIDDAIFKEYEDYDIPEKVTHEKQAFGFNIKYSPLLIYEKTVAKYALKTLEDIKSEKTRVVVIITKWHEIITKKKDKMAFLTLSDTDNEIEAVVFPKVYQRLNKRELTGVLVADIKAEPKDAKQTYIVENIIRIEELK